MPSREWMLAVGNRKEGCGSHSQAGSVLRCTKITELY
jgi:hypothetical protein